MSETEATDIISRLDMLPQKLKNNLESKVDFDPKIHLKLTCCDVGVLTIWVDTYHEEYDYSGYDIFYRGGSNDTIRARNITSLITGETIYSRHKLTHNFDKCYVNYGACMGRNVIKDAQFEGNVFECVDYIEKFYNDNKEELDKLKK